MITELFRNNEKREIVQTSSGTEVETEGNGWNFLTDLFSSRSSKLTSRNSHTFEDIYACINVLSDDIAKLPVKTYRKTNGKVERKQDHAVDRLMTKRPNRYMTPSGFKKSMMVDVLNGGNFYALIQSDKYGKILQLLPLDASVTYPVKDFAGNLFFKTMYDQKERLLNDWEVLHVRGYTVDGILGRSPVKVIADSAESNKAAVTMNKELMESGGTPKGILKVPGKLATEAKERAKEEWVRINGKDAIAIIDSGLEYQQLAMNQRDMQFLEAQKYNQQKIAAIYKMPLHKINNLDHATFSNIEHQSLDYVKNTLTPWIVQIEEEFNTKLFTESEQRRGFYIKFNLDSELRGDATSRAKVHEIKIRNGTLAINEARAQDEMSPFDIEIANEPMATLNYTPLKRLEEYQYKDIDNPVLKQGKEETTKPDEDEETDTTKGGDE